MRERPIIFNTEMVKAIMEGGKTQTQRVVKIPEGGRLKSGTEYCPPNDTHNGGVCVCFDQSGLADFKMLPCPYGQVGDRLWVRETWAADIPGCERGLSYRSDHADPLGDGPSYPMRWRPSIHMPRWASRITLEIVEVRVERVQEITDAGAVREGIPNGAYAVNQITSFARLWDSLNAKRGYSWGSNPWVWVIEFKKLEGE